MLVFEEEEGHVEMRIRLVVAMALNVDTILGTNWVPPHNGVSFTEFARWCGLQENEVYAGQSTEDVFMREAMAPAHHAQFYSLWHFASLAIVTGCRVSSVFPKKGTQTQDIIIFSSRHQLQSEMQDRKCS